MICGLSVLSTNLLHDSRKNTLNPFSNFFYENISYITNPRFLTQQQYPTICIMKILGNTSLRQALAAALSNATKIMSRSDKNHVYLMQCQIFSSDDLVQHNSDHLNTFYETP